jgi:hypothetical protein
MSERKPTKGLGGKGSYLVVSPDALYLGKSYGDYAEDWFNWLLSAKADDRNSGPVVFLSSKHIPNTTTPAGRNMFDFIKLSEGTTTRSTGSSPSDPNSSAPTWYVNEPTIRIGSDRLQIFDDQAVFVPVGVAYNIATVPYMDWGYMQDDLGLRIDSGDNPPDPIQITIDNEPINLDSLKTFRIRTPIFTVVVPDAPYGTSLKDFLEEGQIPPASYPAMVDGYFVMLSELSVGTHWIHSWWGAGREVRGPYFSELLYQIEVKQRPAAFTHGRITTMFSAQFIGVILLLAKRMNREGLLTDADLSTIDSILQNVPT